MKNQKKEQSQSNPSNQPNPTQRQPKKRPRPPYAILLTLLTTAQLTLPSCTKSEKSIQGTVELTPSLQKNLTPTAVLYIIARAEGETAGPPIAVKRFTQPLIFPIEFQLTSKDAMIPDTPLEGKFSITARIAMSGSATPAQAGDIEGKSDPNPVAIGETHLKIKMDKTR